MHQQPGVQPAINANLPAQLPLFFADVFQIVEDIVHGRPEQTAQRFKRFPRPQGVGELGAGYRHKVRVDIRFRDGSIESETREAPRGSEQSFAGANDIVEKFRKLTRGVMAAKQQDALVDAVLKLETLPDSRTLIELLRTG